ncbi:DEG1 [Candida pseudojiufengensis]|uniref:DEG1 n=1 Tax=Candida pseudojiufengensis TaxID=497109 RepID=UPI0022245CAF|nr:DEG1 [Candida pseudojiufengensis]KAI5964293.1 DEG1 [Candida pseudojiufengensis]
MTKPVDYSTWTKEQLIEKLNKLENLPEKELTTKNKPSKEFNWDKYNFRFVALKFAYLGWNYNGLAFQYEPTPLPTIEETLLRCLSKIKLIKEPILETEFSRCGRTDKGVSAMNQVISMKLRSNLTIEEQQDPINDDKEIDYLTVINANLPPDIKIHSICLRPPPNFDARFSCKNRHYKYLFRSKDLNIQAMQEAASYYEGEHDFRNFCKLDGSKQITNFNRFIYSSKIKNLKDDLYYFDLIGTAFLWHQVRFLLEWNMT